MAYDRNANALANLAAAGIERATGVSPYTQWRRLAPAVRGAAIANRVRRDVTYQPGGTQARLGAAVRGTRAPRTPLRSVTTRAGSIYYTGSQQVVIDLLRQAQSAGHLVAFRATFPTDSGEPRTRLIEGNSDQRAALDTATIVGAGDLAGPGRSGFRPLPLDAHLARGRRTRPGVEVSIGNAPGRYARGLDPAEVLAMIRATGGDVWLALFLLWAVGYE